MVEGFTVVLLVAGLYALLAYLIAPAIWSHYDHEPGLREIGTRTATQEGIPGDPLNVGVVGTQSELASAMRAAGWSPADPITFRTSVEITESVLFDRPDPYAPVSNLYYDGRRQDLAFEKQVGLARSSVTMCASGACLRPARKVDRFGSVPRPLKRCGT